MTDTLQHDWADGLVELLDNQRRIYLRLRELSIEQAEFVASGEADALLKVLSDRQQLIDQLTQINGRIEPFKQDWPSMWRKLDDDTRSRVETLIGQVQGLLELIVAQDGRDRASLTGNDAVRDSDGDDSAEQAEP